MRIPVQSELRGMTKPLTHNTNRHPRVDQNLGMSVRQVMKAGSLAAALVLVSKSSKRLGKEAFVEALELGRPPPGKFTELND